MNFKLCHDIFSKFVHKFYILFCALFSLIAISSASDYLQNVYSNFNVSHGNNIFCTNVKALWFDYKDHRIFKDYQAGHTSQATSAYKADFVEDVYIYKQLTPEFVRWSTDGTTPINDDSSNDVCNTWSSAVEYNRTIEQAEWAKTDASGRFIVDDVKYLFRLQGYLDSDPTTVSISGNTMTVKHTSNSVKYPGTVVVCLYSANHGPYYALYNQYHSDLHNQTSRTFDLSVLPYDDYNYEVRCYWRYSDNTAWGTSPVKKGTYKRPNKSLTLGSMFDDGTVKLTNMSSTPQYDTSFSNINTKKSANIFVGATVKFKIENTDNEHALLNNTLKYGTANSYIGTSISPDYDGYYSLVMPNYNIYLSFNPDASVSVGPTVVFQTSPTSDYKKVDIMQMVDIRYKYTDSQSSTGSSGYAMTDSNAITVGMGKYLYFSLEVKSQYYVPEDLTLNIVSASSSENDVLTGDYRDGVYYFITNNKITKNAMINVSGIEPYKLHVRCSSIPDHCSIETFDGVPYESVQDVTQLRFGDSFQFRLKLENGYKMEPDSLQATYNGSNVSISSTNFGDYIYASINSLTQGQSEGLRPLMGSTTEVLSFNVSAETYMSGGTIGKSKLGIDGKSVLLTGSESTKFKKLLPDANGNVSLSKPISSISIRQDGYAVDNLTEDVGGNLNGEFARNLKVTPNIDYDKSFDAVNKFIVKSIGGNADKVKLQIRLTLSKQAGEQYTAQVQLSNIEKSNQNIEVLGVQPSGDVIANEGTFSVPIKFNLSHKVDDVSSTVEVKSTVDVQSTSSNVDLYYKVSTSTVAESSTVKYLNITVNEVDADTYSGLVVDNQAYEQAMSNGKIVSKIPVPVEVTVRKTASGYIATARIVDSESNSDFVRTINIASSGNDAENNNESISISGNEITVLADITIKRMLNGTIFGEDTISNSMSITVNDINSFSSATMKKTLYFEATEMIPYININSSNLAQNNRGILSGKLFNQENINVSIPIKLDVTTTFTKNGDKVTSSWDKKSVSVNANGQNVLTVAPTGISNITVTGPNVTSHNLPETEYNNDKVNVPIQINILGVKTINANIILDATKFSGTSNSYTDTQSFYFRINSEINSEQLCINIGNNIQGDDVSYTRLSDNDFKFENINSNVISADNITAITSSDYNSIKDIDIQFVLNGNLSRTLNLTPISNTGEGVVFNTTVFNAICNFNQDFVCRISNENISTTAKDSGGYCITLSHNGGKFSTGTLRYSDITIKQSDDSSSKNMICSYTSTDVDSYNGEFPAINVAGDPVYIAVTSVVSATNQTFTIENDDYNKIIKGKNFDIILDGDFTYNILGVANVDGKSTLILKVVSDVSGELAVKMADDVFVSMVDLIENDVNYLDLDKLNDGIVDNITEFNESVRSMDEFNLTCYTTSSSGANDYNVYKQNPYSNYPIKVNPTAYKVKLVLIDSTSDTHFNVADTLFNLRSGTKTETVDDNNKKTFISRFKNNTEMQGGLSQLVSTGGFGVVDVSNIRLKEYDVTIPINVKINSYKVGTDHMYTRSEHVGKIKYGGSFSFEYAVADGYSFASGKTGNDVISISGDREGIDIFKTYRVSERYVYSVYGATSDIELTFNEDSIIQDTKNITLIWPGVTSGFTATTGRGDWYNVENGNVQIIRDLPIGTNIIFSMYVDNTFDNYQLYRPTVGNLAASAGGNDVSSMRTLQELRAKMVDKNYEEVSDEQGNQLLRLCTQYSITIDDKINCIIVGGSSGSSQVQFIVQGEGNPTLSDVNITVYRTDTTDPNADQNEIINVDQDPTYKIGYPFYFNVEGIGEYSKSKIIANKEIPENSDESFGQIETANVNYKGQTIQCYKLTGTIPTIILKNVVINNYEISFNRDNCEIYTLKNETAPEQGYTLLEGNTFVKHGENKTIKFKINSGYDISTLNPEIKILGVELGIGADENQLLEPKQINNYEKVYTLTNVTRDLSISTPGLSIIKHKVQFKEIGNLANNGDSTKFNINFSEKESEKTVDYSSAVIYPNTDKLLSHNIENTLIINLEPKYTQSDIVFTAKDNNAVKVEKIEDATLSEGQIKIRLQISDENEIYLSGFTVNQYDITFPSNVLDTLRFYYGTQNTEIAEEDKIRLSHGDAYSFRISAIYGYDASSAIVSTVVNDVNSTITGVNEGPYVKYVIDKVVGPTTIVVQSRDEKGDVVVGLQRSKHSIEFEVTNATLYIDSTKSTEILLDKTSLDSTQLRKYPYAIEHEGNYTFFIESIEGYNLDNFEITVSNGSNVDVSDESGMKKCTVNRVTEAITFIIRGINPNEYPIVFKSAAISDIDNNPIYLPDLVVIHDNSGNLATKSTISENNNDVGVLNGIAYYHEDFLFKIDLNDPYTQSNISAFYNNNELAKSGEYWRLTGDNINDTTKNNIQIDIRGIGVNKYSISFDGEGVAVYNSNDEELSKWTFEDNKPVEQLATDVHPQISYKDAAGSTYQFKLRAYNEYGYEFNDNDLNVYSNSGTVTFKEDIKNDSGVVEYKIYSLSGVSSDATVYITGINSKFYTFGFVDSDSGRFKIINRNGRDITSSVRVSNGDIVEFKVELSSKYNKSPDLQLVIDTTQGNPGTASVSKMQGDGWYSAGKITGDTYIKLENLVVNKYDISFPDNNGILQYYYSTGDQTFEQGILGEVAEHDGEYTFRLGTIVGYNLENLKVSATNATVTNTMLTGDRAGMQEVKLSNIVGNIILEFSGVELNLYDVTFKFVEEYYEDGQIKTRNVDGSSETHAKVYTSATNRDITKGTRAYHNKPFNFTIELLEGYTQSNLTAKIGDIDIPLEQTTSDNGDNTDISGTTHITNDTIITIALLKINNYNVTLKTLLNGDPHATFYDDKDRPISLYTQYNDVVKHGESYKFKIKADTGYILKDVIVKAYGADITINHTNDYNVDVILGNVRNHLGDSNPVVISNIKENYYLVKFDEDSISNMTILDENLLDVTKTGKQVIYGSPFSFTLKPDFGYEQCISELLLTYTKPDVDDDQTYNIRKSENLDATWTIDRVDDAMLVKIGNIRRNRYNITLKGAYVTYRNSVTDNLLTDNDKVVMHGDYFNFKVVANEGFNLTNMAIDANSGELTLESKSSSEAVYTLREITTDIIIDVRVDRSKVTVTFEPAEGLIYQEPSAQLELLGTQTSLHGDDYKFVVRPNDGYDIRTLVVNEDDVILTRDITDENQEDYYEYTLPAVKSDVKVTASINKKKFKISVPEIDGVKFYENGQEIKSTDLIQVEYLDRFVFTMSLDSAHDHSSPVVKYNGQALDAINGEYTIIDIADNIEISVENVEVNTYTINLTDVIGAYYSSIDNPEKEINGIHVVTHNSSFSFGVTAREGYNLSQMVVVCKDEDGKSYSLEPRLGVYTIPNITDDKFVSINDVEETQYKLTFNSAEGVTYMNADDAIITEPVNVLHGRNFEFKVVLDDAYDDSVPLVRSSSNSSGITKVSEGNYTVSNIVSDVSVDVLNVTRNTYNVSLTKTTGVMYQNVNGREISGDQVVKHADDFVFKIGLYTAYTDSDITVMLGKDEVKREDDGTYIIQYVEENKTITVIGVTENEEVAVITAINNLSNDIQNASDVDSIVDVTKKYNNLSSDEKRAKVTNYDKLQSLQQKAGDFSHMTNDITVDGVDWYIKLVAVPLSTSADACGRIYKKLNTEFILSLYDIYLYNMLEGQRYNLDPEQSVTVKIPTPDLTYFKNPLAVHEKSDDGKLEYLVMDVGNEFTTFTMNSFSAVGLAAEKSLDTGYSSLYDSYEFRPDNVVNVINGIITNNNRQTPQEDYVSYNNSSSTSQDVRQVSLVESAFDSLGSTISDTTGIQKGSAILLLIIILIALIVLIILAIIWQINKKRRNKH